jgi:hypothetical protein
MCHSNTTYFRCGHTLSQSIKCERWVRKYCREKTGIWSRIRSWTKKCKMTQEIIGTSLICLECKVQKEYIGEHIDADQVDSTPVTEIDDSTWQTWSWSRSAPPSPAEPSLMIHNSPDIGTSNLVEVASPIIPRRIQPPEPFPAFDQKFAKLLVQFENIGAATAQRVAQHGPEYLRRISKNHQTSVYCHPTAQYESFSCFRCQVISQHPNRNRTSLSLKLRFGIELQSFTGLPPSYPVSDKGTSDCSSDSEDELLRHTRRDTTREWVETTQVSRGESQTYLAYNSQLRQSYTVPRRRP